MSTVYPVGEIVYVPSFAVNPRLVVSFSPVPTDLGPTATAEDVCRFRQLRTRLWGEDGQQLQSLSEAELAAYQLQADVVAAAATPTRYCYLVTAAN